MNNPIYYSKPSEPIKKRFDESIFCALQKDNNEFRSNKGLKVLSVRIRDIVIEKKRATYKQVADTLIQELNKHGLLIQGKHKKGDRVLLAM